VVFCVGHLFSEDSERDESPLPERKRGGGGGGGRGGRLRRGPRAAGVVERTHEAQDSGRQVQQAGQAPIVDKDLTDSVALNEMTNSKINAMASKT
jgi:hypothetical protein